MDQDTTGVAASEPTKDGKTPASRRAARLASLDSRTLGSTSIWLTGSERPFPKKRTYITLGLERGGTSAIAGIQRGLGLYLGEIDKGNNEDQAFTGYRLARIRKSVAHRNKNHDVWGFKYPKAVMYMPQMLGNLRNPYFIIVYRDTVATAISHLGWTGDKNRKPAPMAVHEANSFSNTNTSFAFASGRPTLVISHELSMRKPSNAIDELARFLDVEPPDETLRQKIIDYIEPGSYKNFEKHFNG